MVKKIDKILNRLALIEIVAGIILIVLGIWIDSDVITNLIWTDAVLFAGGLVLWVLVCHESDNK